MVSSYSPVVDWITKPEKTVCSFQCLRRVSTTFPVFRSVGHQIKSASAQHAINEFKIIFPSDSGFRHITPSYCHTISGAILLAQ